MFYLAQLNTLADSIKGGDPNAVLDRDGSVIHFTLPDGRTADAKYISQGLDREGDDWGTIMLEVQDADRRTEFDSLQYAIDGIASLMEQSIPRTDGEDKPNLAEMDADSLSGDLVEFLFDMFHDDASYIGEGRLKSGDIAMRFEMSPKRLDEIKSALKARYGERISFGTLKSQYAPEKTSFCIVAHEKAAAAPATEAVSSCGRSVSETAGSVLSFLYDTKRAKYLGEKSTCSGKPCRNNNTMTLCVSWDNPSAKARTIAELSNKFPGQVTFAEPDASMPGYGEITVSGDPRPLAESAGMGSEMEEVDNFPMWAIEPMVNDSWGDVLQYYGKNAEEDFRDVDEFMTRNGYCGIACPDDSELDNPGFTNYPAFGKGTNTCKVMAYKGQWSSLCKRFGIDQGQSSVDAGNAKPEISKLPPPGPDAAFESISDERTDMQDFCESVGISACMANAVMEAYEIMQRDEKSSDEQPIREVTREEFLTANDRIMDDELKFYDPDACNLDEIRESFRRSAIDAWNHRKNTYTVDGTDVLMTTRNNDGTTYIWLVYVTPEHRGMGIGSRLIRKCIEDYPDGVSLHTNRGNENAKRLYERLGFKEYPCKVQSEIFMATKPDIGGREWWGE